MGQPHGWGGGHTAVSGPGSRWIFSLRVLLKGPVLTDLHVGSMVMLWVHPIFNADWWLILQNGGDKGRPKEAILVPGTSQVAVRASERVARRAVGAPAHSQDERDRGGLVRAGTQLLSGIL